MVTASLPPATELSARAARAHAMKNCASIIYALSRLPERAGRDQSQRWHHLQAAAGRLRQLLVEDISEEVDEAAWRHRPRQVVCVESLTMAVAERMFAPTAEAGVALTVSCGGGSMVGDPTALSEALYDIAANAVEATPRDGSVALETRQLRNGDQLWILRDTGHGIPPDQLAGLGHARASRKVGGSGVGLSLARETIARHGGTLLVESDACTGTRVIILLPNTACEDRW